MSAGSMQSARCADDDDAFSGNVVRSGEISLKTSFGSLTNHPEPLEIVHVELAETSEASLETSKVFFLQVLNTFLDATLAA